MLPSGIFLFLQLALIGYFVYKARRVPLPALAFTVFLLSYAFFAWLIGEMAFTDRWL